ncbi:hypothetical protein BC828DRAFT_252727 [Blastocladiella britannica]|nr:hypothetical protein BC828DRAFT_252727 [Blastocladiella britannica]
MRLLLVGALTFTNKHQRVREEVLGASSAGAMNAEAGGADGSTAREISPAPVERIGVAAATTSPPQGAAEYMGGASMWESTQKVKVLLVNHKKCLHEHVRIPRPILDRAAPLSLSRETFSACQTSKVSRQQM